jgi:antitoxin (DNA-binding transcriptional repressor) of toxin-antitoxin stability system
MPAMAKEVIHISEAEAASDFAAVLARVRAGAEIVIDGQEPIVVAMRPSKPQPGRLLSESIALAEAHGSTVTLDGDFTRDLEDIINSHREPLNPPACSRVPRVTSLRPSH